jgi:hypothetical protein
MHPLTQLLGIVLLVLGIFAALRFWRTRRDVSFIRGEFARVLGGSVLKAVEEDEPLVTSPRQIEFLLVLINDQDLTRISPISASVLELAAQHRADVLGFDASLMLLACGAVFSIEDLNAAANRRSLATALVEKLPKDVSVLHGSVHGRAGSIGLHSRMSWTVLLPGFRKLLRDLVALPHGVEREVT